MVIELYSKENRFWGDYMIKAYIITRTHMIKKL